MTAPHSCGWPPFSHPLQSPLPVEIVLPVAVGPRSPIRYNSISSALSVVSRCGWPPFSHPLQSRPQAATGASVAVGPRSPIRYNVASCSAHACPPLRLAPVLPSATIVVSPPLASAALRLAPVLPSATIHHDEHQARRQLRLAPVLPSATIDSRQARKESNTSHFAEVQEKSAPTRPNGRKRHRFSAEEQCDIMPLTKTRL